MKKINYDIILNNLNSFERNTILVLKDNAYGFGFSSVLQIAIKLGFTFFAVSKKEDALFILRRYSNIKVLLLGKEKMFGFDNLYITVCDDEDYEYAVANKQNFHLKIRSKMNRFGVSNPNPYMCPYLKGIYTHIGSKKENDILNEIETFRTSVCMFNDRLIHIGGSKCLHFNHQLINRIGFDIYKNALSLFGTIIKIVKLKKGECLGYDLKFKAKKDCVIGIIDVGYSSGLSRLNEKKYVYINNKKYDLVGYKCMDYSFVVIDDEVSLHQTVEILGANITLDMLARQENKSPYELLVQLK